MENRQNHQDPFFDVYCAGLKATAGLMNASLEAVARLRKQQLAAINAALVPPAVVVAEIDHAKLIEEMIAVPGKLARLQHQALLCCWNGVFQGAGGSIGMAAEAASSSSLPLLSWRPASHRHLPEH